MSDLERGEIARARLAAIVESSEEAIIAIRNDGVITDWNEAATRLYGYSAEEAIGRNITTIVPPSHTVEFEEIQNAIAAGGRIHQLDTVRLRKDGSPVDVSLSVAPMIDKDGVVIGSAGIARDISSRKRMVEALRRSEDRFREVVENINEVFWMMPPSADELLYVSPAYEKIWGRSCASLYQRPMSWPGAIHPDDAEQAYALFARQIKGEPVESEYRIRTPNGQEKWISDRAFPIRDRTGRLIRVVGVAREITEEKRYEAELVTTNRALNQAKKMEAIGQMAGAVAHDFNNLLMGISMQTELLTKTPDPCKAEERVRAILSATESAGVLTKKLLAFSRIQELATSTFDLNGLVGETREFIGCLLPETISVETRLSPAPCWVNADRVQMEQIIINLVLNARDAMPEGGTLVVSISHIDVSANDLGLHGGVPAGAYALISVADTGYGIPEQHMEKIFEPFFTTKPKERGTGLGLSIADGVVSQSGGQIRVKSTVGAGSTFTIYIPSVERPPAEPPKLNPCPLEISEASCPQAGTVLVVDDEAIVRRSIRAYLEMNGLTVLDCADATEALKVASELKDRLALLITDIVMPNMTGIELARALVKHMPELPIIFMSGYAAGEKGHEEFSQAKFLQKPFACATLLDTVCKGLQICPRKIQN